MENVLVASLGESPVVVTAMYSLLTVQEGLEINKVVVLHPEGEKEESRPGLSLAINKVVAPHPAELIPLAFDLIQEALKDRCEVVSERLPFEDADNEADSFI